MTILRRISDTLLIGIILVVLFGVVLGRVVPLTGRQTLVIGGGSMEPSIALGAAVVVEPVAPADIRVGDVVSLRTGPQLSTIFTHRVTRIAERSDGIWLETKGDANTSIDPSLTPAKHIIGRVPYSIPYAGYLLTLLSMPSGVLLVVLLALLLLAFTWLLESLEVERVGRARPVVGGGRDADATQAAATSNDPVDGDALPGAGGMGLDAPVTQPMPVATGPAPAASRASSRARSAEARAARARRAREARLRRRGAVRLSYPATDAGWLPD